VDDEAPLVAQGDDVERGQVLAEQAALDAVLEPPLQRVVGQDHLVHPQPGGERDRASVALDPAVDDAREPVVQQLGPADDPPGRVGAHVEDDLAPLRAPHQAPSGASRRARARAMASVACSGVRPWSSVIRWYASQDAATSAAATAASRSAGGSAAISAAKTSVSWSRSRCRMRVSSASTSGWRMARARATRP